MWTQGDRHQMTATKGEERHVNSVGKRVRQIGGGQRTQSPMHAEYGKMSLQWPHSNKRTFLFRPSPDGGGPLPNARLETPPWAMEIRIREEREQFHP